MSKQSGLGDQLYVAGYNVSGDVGSLGRIGGGPAALEITGIDKSGFERIGGVRDGAIEYDGFFNDAAGQLHPVLSALPTTDVLVTYLRGTTLGNPAASVMAKQIGYDPTRAADGQLTIATRKLANGYGLEWGRTLTAGIRTDSGAANGTGVDFGASTDFGLQAYLHVFDFTGTDVTIKLQESSDDGSGDAYADVTGGAFTQITGSTPLTERIATSASLTVEQWLRVVTVTTGGFSDLDFAVMVVKNASTPEF